LKDKGSTGPSDGGVKGEGGAQSDGEDKKQKNKTPGIADYLSAPRKKRKSYVVLAMGRGMKPDVTTGIVSFVRSSFKMFALSQPKNIDELRKQFTRQIVLLVFDDEFTDLEGGLKLIEELKKKKNATTVPVLFLTRNQEDLISEYNKKLLPFHETDEYINYAKMPMVHILSKVKSGLTNRNKRRSRRYKIELSTSYFSLVDDVKFTGKLLDLSIHGALLKAEDGKLFRLGDQLKLQLPIGSVLGPAAGDYLKLSARVRRVFISGNQAGISFEYVTEKQLLILTRFLTEVVNSQTARRILPGKGRSAGARP
jgi:hypothetical protein